MEPIIIQKTGTKAIQIKINEFKGTKSLNLMELWKGDETEEEWKFSKKNVSFNGKNIDAFYEAIEKNKEFIMGELKTGE